MNEAREPPRCWPITTPSKICTRSLSPSLISVWTRTLSPERRLGHIGRAEAALDLFQQRMLAHWKARIPRRPAGRESSAACRDWHPERVGSRPRTRLASSRRSSSVSGCAAIRSGRRARVSRRACAPAPARDRLVVARQQHRRARPARSSRRGGSTAGTRGARPRTTRRRPTARSRARPGTSRATASMTTAAASSPPASTKSPMLQLLVDQRRRPFVDALVAPADERHARPRPPARARRAWSNSAPARRQQDAARRAARGRDRVQRGGDRLDAHDHPRPAAVGRVVDLPVAAGAKSRGFVR